MSAEAVEPLAPEGEPVEIQADVEELAPEAGTADGGGEETADPPTPGAEHVDAPVDQVAEVEPGRPPASSPPSPTPEAQELTALRAQVEAADAVRRLIESDPAALRAYAEAAERRGLVPPGYADNVAPQAAPRPKEDSLEEVKLKAKQLMAAGKEDEATLLLTNPTVGRELAAMRVEMDRDKASRASQAKAAEEAVIRQRFQQELSELARTMPAGFITLRPDKPPIYKDAEWHQELVAAANGVSARVPIKHIACLATISQAAKRAGKDLMTFTAELLKPAAPITAPVARALPKAAGPLKVAPKPVTSSEGPTLRYRVQPRVGRRQEAA